LKLKEARIINNCFEETLDRNQIKNIDIKKNLYLSNGNQNYSFHPYICIIAIFNEIEAKEKSVEVYVQYEYIAQNILRFRDNRNKSLTNSIIWYYDNNKRLQSIENIKFTIEIIDFKLNLNNQNQNNSTLNTSKDQSSNFIGYPDKFFLDYNNDRNSTIITWNFKNIPENDYQKISIDIPMFNSKCRKLVKKFFLNCLIKSFLIYYLNYEFTNLITVRYSNRTVFLFGVTFLFVVYNNHYIYFHDCLCLYK
jgi:hypothetical protein